MRKPQPVNTRFLISVLEQKGISQRKLAKILGLDAATVFNMIHGNRRVHLNEAAKIADILNADLNEILPAFGLDLGGLEASIQPQGTARISGYFDQDLILRTEGLKGKLDGSKGKPGTRSTTVPFPFPSKKSEDKLVARIQSAGSEFEGFDGALVYYRLSKSKKVGLVDPETVGKLCLVKIRGESELRLRVIKRGYVSGRFNLSWLSGKILEEGVEIEGTHPVLWLKI